MTPQDEIEGFKGTPGDWTIVPYGDGDSLVVHSGDDWRVCFMATPGSSHGAMARITADAQLIANAKKLARFVQKVSKGPCGSLSKIDWAYDCQDEASALLTNIIGGE